MGVGIVGIFALLAVAGAEVEGEAGLDVGGVEAASIGADGPESSGLDGALTAETSSVTEMGVEPLSEEELALVESLAAGAEVERAPLALGLSGVLPRSLPDAFDGDVALVEVGRRFIGGDEVFVRGQGGHRVAWTLDGVPLHHALSAANEMSPIYSLDPMMFESVSAERPGAITRSSRGSAGSLNLSTPVVDVDSRIATRTRFAIRSADRSTSTLVQGLVSRPLAGIHIAAGYTDLRALRIATSSVGIESGGAHQRFALSTRARVLGRPGDPLRIKVGLDYDQLLNAVRTDRIGRPVDRSRERLLTLVAGDLKVGTWSASVLLARQIFSSKASPTGTLAINQREQAAQTFFRATALARLIPELALSVSASADSSAGREEVSNRTVELGTTFSGQLAFTSELDLNRVQASLTLTLVYAKTSPENGSGVSRTKPLAQGTVRVPMIGPVSAVGGFSMGLYVPTLVDLERGQRTPETARTFEIGPRFALSGAGTIGATLFYTQLNNAIQEVLPQATSLSVDDVRIVGAEVSASFEITESWSFDGAASWAEGRDTATDAAAIALPHLFGRARILCRLPFANGTIEGRIRAATRRLLLFAREPGNSVLSNQFARLSIAGGFDLRDDLRLTLVIENFLDTPFRAPTSVLPSEGIDVRVGLAWDLEVM